MRVGIDARFVGPQGTGLGKYTEKLIENLAKIDKKNEYVIFLRKSNWDFFGKLPQNFSKSLADIPWYSVSEQIKMPKLFAGENLDLLHVPHFNVPILYGGKFIVTIHDLIHHRFSETSVTTKNPALFKLKRFAYKKVIDHAVKKSASIITPSNFVKNDIAKTFNIDQNKIVVTYEAAEEEYSVETKNEKPETGNQLVYVGNAYPHKNLSNLLDALVILNTKYKIQNTRLTLVCPRDVFWQRLKDEIKNRNLEHNVSLKGYLEAWELKKLFRESTAYIFPSLSEGFGIPGLNAMSSGLPVVASNIPVLKEVYGDAALYFDPQNPGDIAEKIKKIITYSTLRSMLVKKGIDKSQKYSWNKMAQETLDVYETA